MRIYSKFALIAVLALSSAIAFAGDKQSLKFTIHETAIIAGVKVPAGDYRMLLDREGDAVKFSLVRGNKTFVNADAHFAPLSSFSAETAIVTGAHAKVKEIQLAKLKGAIVFD